jgi:hypothetical protein
MRVSLRARKNAAGADSARPSHKKQGHNSPGQAGAAARTRRPGAGHGRPGRHRHAQGQCWHWGVERVCEIEEKKNATVQTKKKTTLMRKTFLHAPPSIIHSPLQKQFSL